MECAELEGTHQGHCLVESGAKVLCVAMFRTKVIFAVIKGCVPHRRGRSQVMQRSGTAQREIALVLLNRCTWTPGNVLLFEDNCLIFAFRQPIDQF